MQTATRNIGTNRGNRRVWIEGDLLAANGWTRGTRYNRIVEPGRIHLQADPAGRFKVAGTADRPILDLCGQWVTAWADDAESVVVDVTAAVVRISL